MPRRCSVCDHVARSTIESLLKANNTYPSINQYFKGVSEGSLLRHKKLHMGLTVPRKNELLAKWEPTVSETSWRGWNLKIDNKDVGLLYLQTDLRPASSDFLLKKVSAVTIDFKL